MEVGRGSAVSNNDFQERRKTKTKKKFGSLPLGVFLSFNDRGVHPKCPNASNSYHKCGRHCFDKIPPEGDSDWGKKFEKEGVNPNCPNASNPYHKCAEYCLENLQDQPAMKPKEEKKGGLTTDRLVKSECKFTSNPYHVCAEYCLESVPTRDQPEQTMRLKSSREVKKAPMKKERTTGSPPPCKHKSIPYHECTEICLQSAPNRNLAKREKPNGDSVNSDKRNAHLNRSASVPFHTVTEYCLEDTLEKEHPKRAIKPKEESDIVATVKSRVIHEGKSNNSHGSTTFRVQNVPDRKTKEGENPGGVSITTDNTSEHHKPKHLSSPHQKMTEYFFEDTAEKELPQGVKLEEEIEVVRSLPEREHHEGFMKSKKDKAVDLLERGLSSRQDVPRGRATLKAKEEKKVFSSPPRMNSECKNASNPYHKCAEFCNEIVLERDQSGKTFTMSKQKEIVDFPSEGAVNPDCQYASNPYHVCAEYCFENVPKREKRRQEKPNGDSVKSDKRNVHLNRSASVPFHTVTEYCLEDTLEKEHPKRAIKPKEESDIVATVKSRVIHEGKSNNSHGSTTFRVQNVPDRKTNEGENPGGVSIATDNTSEHHKPKHLSSPHQKMTEYFFEDTAEKELPEGVKLEEEIEVVRSLPEREHHEGFMKSKEDKAVDLLERGLSSRQDVPRARAILKAKEEKKVFSSLPRMNSECKNASNPYHKCAEFCNEIVLERDQPGKTFTRSKQKEIVDFPSEGAVNPDCQFASNPYHVCAEYCFENVPKRENRRQDMKLKGLKELKILLSNKKITSGQPQCNFASNPYHKCTEYCLNSNMPDRAIKTNEMKKDNNYSTRRDVDPNQKHASKKNEEAEGIKAFKEKNRDSSLRENKRDLIMERKSSASSSLQDDGMKKRSAESKHVDASNPINDKFDSRDVTKDLHSAKVVDMILKEPAAVQLTDSSDILHEWAKYCSQKGADVVGIPVQEKIANAEGEVFLKEHASENQKVQTNRRLACSLPILLLFLLGFVLSAVRGIQMIHSFIVSPEKFKGGGEKMKAEGDGDHECRIVSDPYHICADCCFQGSGE
ncbi:hypothetical protein KSP39_PZI008244 [Platanthera zijinensis]|uniref:Uncharacterized protein n=1 Tax=Platanthera zijinensis TaxID=2320716 RepID=A0AAP0BLT2_9ASPA